MSNVNKNAGSEERAAPLLPEGLSYLLGEKPLLWNESEAEYDELLGGIFAALDPRGVIETILVKDIVDYIWEIRRMRSLKIAALQVELPNAAAALLEPSYNAALRNMNAQQIRPLVRGALAGLPVQSQAFEMQMREAHVTPQMLQYEAMKSGLSTITAIEASLVRMEQRRDQLLKQVSDRRQAFKAMARTLLERDAAELVDGGADRPN